MKDMGLFNTVVQGTLVVLILAYAVAFATEYGMKLYRWCKRRMAREA